MDAGTYGRSFADVYDLWYPPDEATDVAVECLSDLAGATGRILELGVGTGRLALPLARRGHLVTGIDASPEMLERLAANAEPTAPVAAVLGDLTAPSTWPQGPFDLVVAAFNLVCNLVHDGEQAAMFGAAHAVLVPGGALVVETYLPAVIDGRQRHLDVREVTEDAVILIASDADPARGLITGQHIELRDGQPARLRPWRLRITTPDELDGWAEAAGLTVESHRDAWDGDPTGDPVRITVYRRPS